MRETDCMPFCFVIRHSSLVFEFRFSGFGFESANPFSSIFPAQFMLSPAVGSRYQTITRMIFGAKL
jgi:hypothetical protein